MGRLFGVSTFLCHLYLFEIFIKKKKGQKNHQISLNCFVHNDKNNFFHKKIYFLYNQSPLTFLSHVEWTESVLSLLFVFEGGKASLSWQACGLTFMCEFFFVHAPCFNNIFKPKGLGGLNPKPTLFNPNFFLNNYFLFLTTFLMIISHLS